VFSPFESSGQEHDGYAAGCEPPVLPRRNVAPFLRAAPLIRALPSSPLGSGEADSAFLNGRLTLIRARHKVASRFCSANVSWTPTRSHRKTQTTT